MKNESTERSELAPEPSRKRGFAAGSISGGRRTVVTLLPVDRIDANPAQPRRHFDGESLAELADSIRERGLLHPVIVRPNGPDRFLLVAGERRFRAVRLAGLDRIPALVRDDDPLEIAMIENLQREDLTPLESARAMQGLIRDRGYTHADLATLLHKSRPYVSNTLALLRLPERVQEEYDDEPTVSREVLIAVARGGDETEMQDLWKRVRTETPSVRQFREVAGAGSSKPTASRKAVTTARRLGRILRALDRSTDLDELESLERTLRRLRRRIDDFLSGAKAAS